jgi:hypothetical protein
MALTMAIQGTNPNATAQPMKRSVLKRFQEAVTRQKPSDRIEDQYGVLKEVAGLRYLQNIKDTEQRRTEILDTMYELNDLEFKIIKNEKGASIEELKQNLTFNTYKLARLFQLYFTTGSPWVRGVDNSTLSQAASDFIQNFEDFGDIPSAFRDLHAEATYLLHLSWQGVDVTNTPAYVISSTPIFAPQNIPRVDLSGGSKPNSATESSERAPSKREHL